jgi:hypothetical protein
MPGKISKRRLECDQLGPFRSSIKKLEQFENEVSRQRVTTFLIKILKHWPLYDVTLRTFTTLKTKNSYDA